MNFINNTTCLVCVHSTDDFHDRLLTESLNSLTLQTFKEFYTLVVLDECWDNTLNIVKLFENRIYGNLVFTNSCLDNNKYLTHDEIKEVIFKENKGGEQHYIDSWANDDKKEMYRRFRWV